MELLAVAGAVVVVWFVVGFVHEAKARTDTHTHDAHREALDEWSPLKRVSRTQIRGFDLADLLAQWRHKCAYCGTHVVEGKNLHIDHVMPLALGGANHVANTVPACAKCNTSKGAKHPVVWTKAKGYACPTYRAVDPDSSVHTLTKRERKRICRSLEREMEQFKFKHQRTFRKHRRGRKPLTRQYFLKADGKVYKEMKRSLQMLQG